MQAKDGSTAFERKKLFRSLCLLVKCLELRHTTVDLRNESSATGRIVKTDLNMNINMEEVMFVEYEGTYKYFEQLFIPGRMVRDIVIPSDVNVKSAMASALPSGKVKKQTKKSKKRTFKQKRAMTRQQEALQLIQDMQKRN